MSRCLNAITLRIIWFQSFRIVRALELEGCSTCCLPPKDRTQFLQEQSLVTVSVCGHVLVVQSTQTRMIKLLGMCTTMNRP